MKKSAIIFLFAFVLNILWENLHSFLYSNYMGGKITEFILLKASLFDALVIIIILLPFLYFNKLKNKTWLIIIIGIVIAVFNEWYGLSTSRWAYNSLMPILPIIKVGLTPAFQLGILAFISYIFEEYILKKLVTNLPSKNINQTMIEIIFEAHGTTFDNEAKIASGHNDVALSQLGEEQSKEMGERYKNDHFDAIFCSDLQRSYKSGEIAFGNKFPIIKDERLRECDYGDFTQSPSELFEKEKITRISEPFPKGESYIETTERIRSFLSDLIKDYDGKRIMIIGHRATQYGLENLINKIPLEQLVSSKFKWQPGWEYKLNTKFGN